MISGSSKALAAKRVTDNQEKRMSGVDGARSHANAEEWRE
jgi:hypothetical protein